MTSRQQAISALATVAHFNVSGGQLTITRRPFHRNEYRLNGFKITEADAARKLG